MSEFRLNALEDGKPLREHYVAAWRATGKRPPQLDQPEFSELVIHIWEWFIELHMVRGSTGFGPCAISYNEIFAWGNLFGITLRKWEVKALCLIDKAYLEESHKSAPK